MPELTPKEKVKKANDDYHSAVEEVMLDEAVEVACRAKFVARAHNIFEQMTQANIDLEECYPSEE